MPAGVPSAPSHDRATLQTRCPACTDGTHRSPAPNRGGRSPSSCAPWGPQGPATADPSQDQREDVPLATLQAAQYLSVTDLMRLGYVRNRVGLRREHFAMYLRSARRWRSRLETSRRHCVKYFRTLLYWNHHCNEERGQRRRYQIIA